MADGWNRDLLREWFEYLDDLRESGDTNMFGASAYLQQDFGLSRDMAREVALGWMRTFDRKSDVEDRVAAFIRTHNG